MAEPDLVADCIIAMQAETDLPVTIKCRIGIDDMDEEVGLDMFVDTLSAAGVQIFYLHARKAWLKGLSPKENRDIPPLNYARAQADDGKTDNDGLSNPSSAPPKGGGQSHCLVEFSSFVRYRTSLHKTPPITQHITQKSQGMGSAPLCRQLQ